MLNKENNRELAYIAEVTSTEDLIGYNKVHLVTILGWKCVAPKSICVGDKVVYFEVDSVLPSYDKRFEFLSKRKYRVKPLKICGVVSQGLALPIIDFPECSKLQVGDFVTDILKVRLYDPDVKESKLKEKASPFQKAMDRHRKFFNFPIIKFMLRFSLARTILKRIFIHKKDKLEWPSWLPKAGSERIQNVPYLLKDKNKKWVLSEKCDGMSTSFIMDSKDIYYVGSHNVIVYSSKDKNSAGIADGNKYIKNNVWLDMGEKYNMRNLLFKIKIEKVIKTIAIQGESYGSGVQKRTYSLKHGNQDFVVFHIWFDGKRLPIEDMVQVCREYNLPHVTIYDYDYILPDTVDELVSVADSKKSGIDGGDIEGFVIYSKDGRENYKCVRPEYLIKYHSA